MAQVMDHALEVAVLVSRFRNGEVVDNFVAYHHEDDQPSCTMALRLPALGVSLNYSNLGSTTAVVVLLLTGHSREQIYWDKVRLTDMLGDRKDPAEVEAFVRFHLKAA